MATLMLIPLPHAGHVNPSLRLAKLLRGLGHRVVFCSMAAAERAVRAEDFEFVPVFEASLPRDYLEKAAQDMAGIGPLGMFRRLREVVRNQNAMCRQLLDGELDRAIAAIRPDLIVHDERFRLAAPVVHGSGVPSLRLHTTVHPRFIQGVFGRPPRGPGPILRAVGAALDRLLQRCGLMPRTGLTYRALLGRQGFAREEDSPFESLGVRVDELVLFPESFAHLGAQAPRLHHVGPCIDLERRQQDFPWERLDTSRPLVLFSMGTRGFTSGLVPRLVEAMAEVAAQRPQWQFVVGVGPSTDPSPLDGRTPNLIAVRAFPQLALLERASAMVTHAGFNTVKECIWAGVPMVALPLMLDQPLIARILTRHGLGVMNHPRRVRATELLELLDEVMGEPSYRAAVQAMSARFREADEQTQLAALIDRLTRERAAAAPRTASAV